LPKPFLQVISARVSRGRVGKPVADYLVGALTGRDKFELEVIDLAEVNLPLMDEPNHPRLGRYTHEHTKAWSATISRGDADLIAMPEYNYSFSGPLKNALDYLSQEWAGKPVALASYGGISGGLRAATALSSVLGALGLVTSRASVAIPWVHSHVKDGVFVGYEQLDSSIDAVHAELVRLHGLLAGH
jgi:NAD(P)H-dependent FMN reductase